MASVTLTKHDISVLEKIKDPESDPSCAPVIDPTLSRDPHITERDEYERLVERERRILSSVQSVELELAGVRLRTVQEAVAEYKECIRNLEDIIKEFPNYASARNNRSQALRRLYGDAMLVSGCRPGAAALARDADEIELAQAAATALSDLDQAISLLSPETPFSTLSPQQANTLSLAHTQRAALYHVTAKHLKEASLRLDQSRAESKWVRLQFEEAASKDFALGGRFGSEIAKGLAVSTNPTAKLCGQMVREAMKKEYGPGYGV